MTYNRKRFDQEQLQRLAADVLAFGAVEKVVQQVATVFEGDQSEVYCTGSRCIIVVGLLSRFWIHVSGTRVFEIVEVEVR